MSSPLAAIDVGSNTVHLLVAEPKGHGLRELRHEVATPRIGRAVQATGRVGAAKLAEVRAEVERMRQIADSDGATILLLAATEAMRRAADRAEVLAALGETAGSECRLISGDAEARLAFRGVSAAHPGPGLQLVADVGGGSTECVLGEDGAVVALASLPTGSGAVTDAFLTDDPPTGTQLTVAREAVRAVLASAPDGRPGRGGVTGGTATTLPVLLGRNDGVGVLSLDDLDDCRGLLSSLSSAAVATRFGIPQARTRVLAGGVEIIAGLCDRYRLQMMDVSSQGLRDGMILAYLANGDAWSEG